MKYLNELMPKGSLKGASLILSPTRKTLILSSFLLLGLAGCETTPLMKIEKSNAAFAQPSKCLMRNNFLLHSENGTKVSFSMMHEETVRGGEATLMIESYDPADPLFSKDARVILSCRGKDDETRRIHLNPGPDALLDAGYQYPVTYLTRLSCKLTEGELVTILTAEWIELNVEKRNGSVFKAVLSPGNMQNIRTFNRQCVMK